MKPIATNKESTMFKNKRRILSTLAPLCVALALSACGDKEAQGPKVSTEEAKAVALIKTLIVSPETAIFQPMLKSTDGTKACIVWEGANNLGARSVKATLLANQNGNWYIPRMDHVIVHKNRCTQAAVDDWNPKSL